MVVIQVLFNEISYEEVCDYYNRHKPNEWSPLQRLERAEGGFCIEIKNHKVDENDIFTKDPNAKIKQLRWFRKSLKTPTGWYEFSNDETMLLYDSICNVYGEDQVTLLN